MYACSDGPPSLFPSQRVAIHPLVKAAFLSGSPLPDRWPLAPPLSAHPLVKAAFPLSSPTKPSRGPRFYPHSSRDHAGPGVTLRRPPTTASFRRAKLPDAVHRVVIDPAKDIVQIGPRIDTVQAAAPRQRIEDRCRACSPFRSRKQPVLSPHHRPPKLKLAHVVVDWKPGMIRAHHQMVPLAKHVLERPPYRSARTDTVHLRRTPGVEFLQHPARLSRPYPCPGLCIRSLDPGFDREQTTRPLHPFCRQRRAAVQRIMEVAAGVGPTSGAGQPGGRTASLNSEPPSASRMPLKPLR